jgi:hypothetical protein
MREVKETPQSANEYICEEDLGPQTKKTRDIQTA